MGVKTDIEMNIKSIIAGVFLCIAFSFGVDAQNNTQFPNICYYYNGAWSDWDTEYVGMQLYTNNGICLYRTHHPSEFFFKCNPSMPISLSSKQIKKKMRSNAGLDMPGTVEYYVTDKYPTIKSILQGISHHEITWDSIGGDYNSLRLKLYGGVAVKRTASASINLRIFNDGKSKWLRYEIWFDNVAIGLKVRIGYAWYSFLYY